MKRLLSAVTATVVGLVALVLPASSEAEQQPPAPSPLRVAVWNICAEFAECPAVADAAGRVDRMAALVREYDLDALLLQETCEWHVSQLLGFLGNGWGASFAPWRQNDAEGGWPGRRTRPCAADRYALGLAVVVKGAHDQPIIYALPSPTVRYSLEAPMLCVRKASPAVRLCASHFTPRAYDATGSLRAAQRARVVEVIRSFGTDKAVFGGDLNLVPPSGSYTPPGSSLGPGSATLNPLYDVLRECDQRDGLALTGAPRAGESTTRWGDDAAPTWGKLDYLFATPYGGDPEATFTACDAIDDVPSYRRYSDHLPLVATLQL